MIQFSQSEACAQLIISMIIFEEIINIKGKEGVFGHKN